MTTEQILQKVHRRYEGSTDYPESGDSDYDLRLALLGDGVEAWADENYPWVELYVTLADAATGDKTTDGTAVIDCPTDFLRPATMLKIGNTYYSFQRKEKTINTLRQDSSAYYFTVVGSPGSKDIHVNPTPESGLTISYGYIKSATRPTTGSDIPQVPRPDYLTYYILAALYEQDYRNDMVNFYEQKMQEELQKMVIDHVSKPADHVNAIANIGNRLYGTGFGV